jgi:hypothetical protein
MRGLVCRDQRQRLIIDANSRLRQRRDERLLRGWIGQRWMLGK